MSNLGSKEDNYQLTFSDVRMLCRQYKRKIYLGMALFACLAVLYALTRPIEYKAEATFREKAKAAGDSSSKTLSLSLLTGGSESNENAAISVMKSRRLFENTILKNNLQITIRKDLWTFYPLWNLIDNLKVDYALARNLLTPALKDPPQWVKAKHVAYQGEVPVNLKVLFTSEEAFVVKDKSGNEIGSGHLGQAFAGPDYAFTLSKATEEPLSGFAFKVTIDPLPVVAERLSKCFKCESDSKDKGMLRLAFRMPRRQDASLFLNMLMANYLVYLKEEHQRIAKAQLNYLHKRQDETGAELKSMMEEHAQTLSSNMASMDFLFQNQQSYTQKLLLIELELRRLQNAQEEGLAFYDRYWIDGGDPVVINQILGEIRAHRQQADSIDIALRNNPADESAKPQRSFSDQMAELDELRDYAREAKAVHAASQAKAPLPLMPKLMATPKYRIKEWLNKIVAEENKWKNAAPAVKGEAKECFERCTSNFNAYVANLVRILDVEEKIMQERLTRQQTPQIELQGIDLVTANSLYIEYSKLLNNIEAEILHHTFILDQMKDPNFEPSSLSTVLQDPVSREMIARASNLVLMIRDQDNRSQKELDRLKSELAQQKGFLAMHVEQTMQLLQLRHKLYQDKILAVQNAQLELIQQKISLLEKHLSDYIESRMVNLKQERQAIEQQQLALQKEMEKMPAKWASEKLIDQHLEMSRKMVEEITKMVEQKNISAHLDISQSSPIDVALPPIQPMSSKFIVFGVLGAFLGGLMMVTFVIGRAALKGIPASQENLRLLGESVVGCLTQPFGHPLSDSNLDVLRRLSVQLRSAGEGQQTTRMSLLMIGQGIDYSQDLAALIQRSGYRVLLLPLLFQAKSQPDDIAGLVQYLEGSAKEPTIFEEERGFDFLPPGGMTRYSNELLASPRFQALMGQLQKEYDWIIAVSRAAPASGEGEHLLRLFDCAAVTIQDEKLQDLRTCLEISRAGVKHITFLFEA